MKKIISKIICWFLTKKMWCKKNRHDFARDRFSELAVKIDTLNRNIDFANGKIIWIESMILTNTNAIDKLSELESRIDTVSRNIDFANSRIIWIESMIRTNTDVSKIPLSQGWQRLMHRAGAKMLELIDIICRDNKIPYFLYAGSLIGARLYEKSVQWDDDWDIGMLRADWERFREIAEALFNNSDFSPTFIGISIQFRFRDSIIYGDIFPFDQYHSDIKTEQEEKELEKILEQAKTKMDFRLWHWEERLQNRNITIPNITDYKKTKELYNKWVMNGKKATEKGVLIENPMNPGFFANNRFNHRTHENNIFRYDWIFPLQRIKYEDIEVYAPNNIDALLGQKYGDIYDLPTQLDTQHGNKVRFSDLNDIEDLLAMDMKKVYTQLKKANEA